MKEKIFFTDIVVEINNPSVQTKYSGIKFDHSHETIQAPTISLGQFTPKVQTVAPNRVGTNIKLGLTACHNLLKSEAGTRSIILLTDGHGRLVEIGNQIKPD